MKKSSLLAIAAASLVGLASCGPAAPHVYTVGEVIVDCTRVAKNVAQPEENTDYYLATDNKTYFCQGSVVVDPLIENQDLVVANEKFDVLKTSLAYLVSVSAPAHQQEGAYVVGSLKTSDERVNVTVFAQNEGESIKWQVQVAPNEVVKGWPGASELQEHIGVTGAELVKPDGSFESQFRPYGAEGSTPRHLLIACDGVNVFEGDAYKTKLVAAEWTVEAEPDSYGYYVAHDKDQKLVVEFKGFAEGEEKGSLIYAYNYEEYYAEHDVTPPLEEMVIELAGIILEDPGDDPSEYWDERGFYQIGGNFGPGNPSAETIINYYITQMPGYLITYVPLAYDENYGWTITYYTSDDSCMVMLQAFDVEYQGSTYLIFYLNIQPLGE